MGLEVLCDQIHRMVYLDSTVLILYSTVVRIALPFKLGARFSALLFCISTTTRQRLLEALHEIVYDRNTLMVTILQYIVERTCEPTNPFSYISLVHYYQIDTVLCSAIQR